MSRFTSCFVIFSNCKKIQYFKSKDHCGWSQLSGWGRAEPGRAGRARSCPLEVQIMGRSPTRPVRFQSHRPSAQPGPRDSNLTRRLPGLAGEIFRFFSLSLRSVSPPRGFVAAMCLLARAQWCLWAAARYSRPAYEVESVIPLYRPSKPLGAAWVT